ncbi:NUDIX domain-containing protein [Balneatrix alpica]|uniref:NUDIX domain-containing protein n=1 Tax=Balneatrix alpica TaxID=75684 RepID=A0ABV5Z9Y9_9GAMM|nr:NUDIX domain-containing protein [Balneatrix alpica]
MTKKATEEWITWVDRDNRVLGQVTRRQMREQGLAHRAVYILLFNQQGELCAHKRTLNKDFRPGWYELTAGGVVAANEDWLVAAGRELAEELGAYPSQLCDHGLFFDEGDGYQVWGRVYSCQWQGELSLQVEEVAEAFYLPPGQAALLDPVTETSRCAFLHWLQHQQGQWLPNPACASV